MSLLIKNISDINIINKMDPKISIPVEQQNNIYDFFLQKLTIAI